MNQSSLYSEGKVWIWLIVAIVVAGGCLLAYYYYYYGAASSTMQESSYLPEKSTSDSVASVEGDLNQMDTTNLDKELTDIDKELAQ